VAVGGVKLARLLTLDVDAGAVQPEALDAQELKDVVAFACTAAGLSTTKPGGISSVPAYDDVMRRIIG